MKKRENFNYQIESFIEKHNGTIQIVFFILVCFVGGVLLFFGAPWGDEDSAKNTSILFSIILTLLLAITVEIILLQIKDSSMQRKINSIGEVVRQQAEFTHIWNKENDLLPFFEKAKNELFISGIVIDKFIEKYSSEIDKLLERNVKINILLESSDEITQAAKFLNGSDYDDNSEVLLDGRIKKTLKYLNEKMKRYSKNGSCNLIEIRSAKAPIINPSIIAYDYSDKYDLATRRTKLQTAPEMSVRFYIQGADGVNSAVKTHPTLLINSNIMPEQYDEFIKILNTMWSSASPTEMSMSEIQDASTPMADPVTT